MRLLFVAILFALGSAALAGDTVDHTDARDRPELGHQIKQAKQEMRRERSSARARFYARKFEARAKSLRASSDK
jgi:hypothetical protein